MLENVNIDIRYFLAANSDLQLDGGPSRAVAGVARPRAADSPIMYHYHYTNRGLWDKETS